MKATFTFKLPEEQDEFELMQKAQSLSIILTELDGFLRSAIKYPSDRLSDEQIEVYQNVRDRLFELASDYEIKI